MNYFARKRDTRVVRRIIINEMVRKKRLFKMDQRIEDVFSIAVYRDTG